MIAAIVATLISFALAISNEPTQIPKAYVKAAMQTKRPYLLLAMSFVESQYAHNRVGAHGEIGPLQIRPQFHPEVTKIPTDDIAGHFKIADRYLDRLAKRCKCLQEAYFVCYNTGALKAKLMFDGSVDKAKEFSYYKKVKEAYRVIRRWAIVQNQGEVRPAIYSTETCKVP